MAKIHSQTDNKTITASRDSTVLEALLKANINHVHVCGGNARCTTCRVYIMEGLGNCRARTEGERQLAEKIGFPEDIRLACQTKITGDIAIRRAAVDELDTEIILKQFGGASGTRLGQEKDIAILFTDISNYTEFAEALPAYDVVHVLHRYYKDMNDIVVQHRGVISDVVGDGILALFGVIEDSENPVLDAINAVLAMNVALTEFNKYLRRMYDCSFGIRAGINFGSVIVGSFDTGLMNKISAIGDAVNLASRIETANKDFGTKLLISQAANEKIEGIVKTHRKYLANLKGKSGKYALYEIEI